MKPGLQFMWHNNLQFSLDLALAALNQQLSPTGNPSVPSFVTPPMGGVGGGSIGNLSSAMLQAAVPGHQAVGGGGGGSGGKVGVMNSDSLMSAYLGMPPPHGAQQQQQQFTSCKYWRPLWVGSLCCHGYCMPLHVTIHLYYLHVTPYTFMWHHTPLLYSCDTIHLFVLSWLSSCDPYTLFPWLPLCDYTPLCCHDLCCHDYQIPLV